MPLSCVLRLACLIALLLSTAYRLFLSFFFFFFNSAATTEIYTLSLHDALPISSYPRDLHHLAYTSVFGGYSFERFGSDGPWTFFDDQANTLILSPASHYMNAALSLGPQNELRSAIIVDGDAIPARFVQTTALVIES